MMSSMHTLPSLSGLKNQAKRLRLDLEQDGHVINHSKSLELIAHQYGYKDWNMIHAAIEKIKNISPVQVGQTVQGLYLGHSFTGQIVQVKKLLKEQYRITVVFDEAIDVVRSDSFSNLRRRVTYKIDQSGQTMEKTSDGQPHLKLFLKSSR